MPRTSDLTGRISELLGRSTELTCDELEEIAQYESDWRITPVDKFNVGLILHRRREYLDALRCFGDALTSYETDGEKGLHAYTLASVGEAAEEIGNMLVHERRFEDALNMYNQAARAFGEALEHPDKIPRQNLPAVLANASAVFYNSKNYPEALQTCALYYALDSIREFTTPKTDAVIDTVFTKARTKIRPFGEG